MDSLTIVKQPPLKLNILAEKQEQCIFENNQLTAKISGGDSSKYNILWSNGNTNVPSIFIFPSQSTKYWVKVSDACSDDQLDTLEIMVHPLPWIEAEVNSPVCFGEDGFAVIRPVDTSQALQIVWNLTPPLFADSIFAKSGAKYVATVTNTHTGCIKDTSLLLPSHPQVKADFRIQTDGNCISPKDENIPIQNLSIGANAGNWIINQNNTYEFVENQNPTIPIPYNQNQISIKLNVKNEFLCEDSMSKSFCIKDTVYLYIPDAFSPNNDGINDLFGIQISTHRFMQFDIYNRWGEMIYSTQDPTFKWNGKYMDKECPTDFYMYKIKYASFGSILEYKSGSFYLLR
jgi:gliding motility-associated-like protein